jgi:hypothetical protein
MIVIKLETISKNKTGVKNLTSKDKLKIREWSKKMYQDYQSNNELELIKNNNLDDKDFEEYIDNNYLIYL